MAFPVPPLKIDLSESDDYTQRMRPFDVERGQQILRKCLAGCQESWGAGGLQTSMWASCCAVGHGPWVLQFPGK